MSAEPMKRLSQQEVMELRAVRDNQFMDRQIWEKRAGEVKILQLFGLLAASMVAVGVVVNTEWNNTEKQSAQLQDLPPDTSAQLADPNQLRKHGACSDELQASRNFHQTVGLRTRNNDGLRTIHMDAVAQFSDAARLAEANSIPCYPEAGLNVIDDSLTPGFDVVTLQVNHQCAETLQAQIDVAAGQTTDAGPSNVAARLHEQQNLAATFNIAC